MNANLKRTGKFAIIGTVLALFNFLVFTLVARTIINNNELLWIDSIISCTAATFLAYLLHSKITWKECTPKKSGIINFFIWNFTTAIIISPFLTWLFTMLTPFYESIFNITSSINLPFDFDFIESTGVFVLTTCVTMVLNYLFYDKLVFGKNNPQKNSTKNPIDIKTKSKVSIIVPIYNTEKYLKSCLDSISSQSYQNLEIILIDDGSTDHSAKIINTYAKKDPRIKVIHQKNQGQSAARNIGLQKATGDYISFIDADDEIKSNFIENLLVPFLNNKNITLTVCGIHYKRLKTKSAENVYINPLRPPKKHESKKAYLLYLLAIDGRMYSSVNKLYKAELAKTLEFDKTLSFAEDTRFVLNYLKKSKGNIEFILEPLYIYNFGTETSTINKTAVNWQNWQTSYQYLKSWLGPRPTPQEKFWLHMVHLRWRISFLRSKRRAR